MVDVSPLQKATDALLSSIQEAKTATREAHEATKALREERKVIERMLGPDLKQTVDELSSAVVKDALDELGPKMRAFSSNVYHKIGVQIDKLIDLALGDEHALKHKRESLRPMLAELLRTWIREQIDEDVVKPHLLIDTTETKPLPCAACHTAFDGMSSTEGVFKMPVAGDRMVCSRCARVNIWSGFMWRLPTDEELAAALNDERLSKIIDHFTKHPLT